MTTLAILVALAAILVLVAGLVWFASSTQRKVETALPPEGAFIDVDGTPLHYRDSEPDAPRDRDTLLLVHGLGAQMQHLTHSLFDELAPHYRVLAIDRPGHGHSPRPKGHGGSPSDYAWTIKRFIDLMDLDRPVLIGHSLGGAIVTATALDHPNSTRGLVLIAPALAARDEAPERFKGLVIRNDLARRLVSWTLAVPMSIRSGPETQVWGFSPEPAPQDFPTRGGGLLGLRPGSFHSASLDIVSVSDALPGMMERYPSLTVPAAIIHGDADAVVPHGPNALEQGPRLGPNGAAIEIMEGRGHMIPVTAAPEVALFTRRHADAWFERAAA